MQYAVSALKATESRESVLAMEFYTFHDDLILVFSIFRTPGILSAYGQLNVFRVILYETKIGRKRVFC